MTIIVFKVSTRSQAFPEGTVAGMWQWWLTDHNDQVILGPTQTDKLEFFANIVPPSTGTATYTVFAVRLNEAGDEPLGAAVSTQFSLTGTDVVIEVAGSISATIVPETNPT